MSLEGIKVRGDVGGPVFACSFVIGVEQSRDDLFGALALGELEPGGRLLVGEREPLPTFAVLVGPGA
jgi:hypothetical protein